MELIGEVDGIRLFDDFAHHPTAIQLTLSGAKAAMQQQDRSGRLVAVLEPRSNTMKMGEHKEALADSVAAADAVFWLQPAGLSWSLQQVTEGRGHVIENSADALQQALAQFLQPGDDVIIMSNGSFSGLHNKLLQQLQQERS
jgi:UDP-N-acetylmuramate: L-alanyl-gamma-D-glutamyl-meso-diaminopimelate ligase